MGSKKRRKNEGTGNKLQSRQKWGYGRNGKNRKRRTEGKIWSKIHLHRRLQNWILQRMQNLPLNGEVQFEGWFSVCGKGIRKCRCNRFLRSFLLGRCSRPVQGVHRQVDSLVQHSWPPRKITDRKKRLFHRSENGTWDARMRKIDSDHRTFLRPSRNRMCRKTWIYIGRK